MTLDEVIEKIKFKSLNGKCNHFIIYDLKEHEIAMIQRQVSPKSLILNYNEINFCLPNFRKIKMMTNVFMDSKIEIKDLLNEILRQLQINVQISFEDHRNLKKFRSILRKYEQSIQLIVFQSQALDMEKQKQLNELFTLNSYFMSITYLLKEHIELSTYQTLHGEMLDDRKNYQKIYITHE